jgi:photosystem II stability/assembly factor-like uncharacterized protein
MEVRAMDTPAWSLQFLNDHVGYVSSRWEYIVKTVDGGNTWQELPVEGGESRALSLRVFEGCRHVTFLNESVAWGYGIWVWRTLNSGGKWEKISSEDGFDDDLLVDGIFLDRDFGCVSSGQESQAIWCTHDGQTWTAGVFGSSQISGSNTTPPKPKEPVAVSISSIIITARLFAARSSFIQWMVVGAGAMYHARQTVYGA